MTGLVGRFKLALFGAFGGILPEVVALYQSRIESLDYQRYSSIQYLILTVVYLGSAALVAAIYPYRHPTAWRATVVGITLPTIVGITAGAAKTVMPSEIIFNGRGGPSAFGDLLSLLALF